MGTTTASRDGKHTRRSRASTAGRDSRGYSGTKSSSARSPLYGVGGDTVVAAGHYGP
uniref:Uncharacterized protein n=1 Tax=Oryza sativa subsp. japonica TaxID=39947 RepID=Q7EYD5_ORYSJ|nr:hypothetical protein [Oryza sativa Japonica Group]BAD33532.1 hypothetical protein [Oryza sativa Japonica Group]